MKRHIFIFLSILLLLFAFSTNSFPTTNSHPKELQGYWETQSVTVNGKKDGGEEGSYLILRFDGTYRIAKKGKKPEGTWSVNNKNLLVLLYNGQPMMASNWIINNDKLTLSYTIENTNIVIKYVKRNHSKEPKAPDEI